MLQNLREYHQQKSTKEKAAEIRDAVRVYENKIHVIYGD